MEKPSQNGGDSDQDFDPSAEMLVNDFDDEHTLDLEEQMESGESVGNELDDLQKEGEMPLDDLLAMYGLGNNTSETVTSAITTTKKEAAPPKPPPPNPIPVSTVLPPGPVPVTQVKVLSKTVELLAPSSAKEIVNNSSEDKVLPKTVEKPAAPIVEIQSATRHLLRACKSISQPSESSGSESDDDKSPDSDWRKTIQVGSDYQASIPEGLCKYDGAPAYENEDRLLWDPVKLGDEEVIEYLRQAQLPHSTALPIGSHTRDDEQALYLLLQCGHNVEEALRRRRMQPTHATDTMSLWSEEECRSFENGLRTYGKDFHLIQQNKVRTRAVGELVQFYYLWKKTERHDVFASKTRLEKKKYALHPGTTDYMDRFLDEQENPTAPRDRSSSPNMQSLLHGEGRKQVSSSTSNNTSRPGSTSSPPNSNANQQKNNPPHSVGLSLNDCSNSPSKNGSGITTRSPGSGNAKYNNSGIPNGVEKPSNAKSRNWPQTHQAVPLALTQNAHIKDSNSAVDYAINPSAVATNEPGFSSSLQDSTVSSGN